MEYNIILAGVGGQGILTIAQAISLAAMRRGLRVKQAEVHGMSQRGGAVQSHLRLADHDLYSDLIPRGRADMILSVEPMEVLRYVEYLGEDGVIVSSSVPTVNIPNYGPVEKVLDQISRYPRHVLLDADSIAKAAGSIRSANSVMLGAASPFMGIAPEDFEAALAKMFLRKGQKLVDINHLAFQLGGKASNLYRDGLLRGVESRSVRQWIASIPAEKLGETDVPEAGTAGILDQSCELSPSEVQAINQTLESAYKAGRRQLYEHEVYKLVELAGATSPPKHAFIPAGMPVTEEILAEFPGDKVVLKIVSPEIVHKSDSGAVVFASNDLEVVSREVEQMLVVQGEISSKIEGVLIIEFVEHGGVGFGQELFVGIRSTREFGPVIAAGLGGVDTEYLAQKLKPGFAVAKALAADTSPEEFFALFQRTAAYEILSGQARGHTRIASDGELMRCFRAFIAIARRFCIDRGEEGPDVGELEVNPFAFRRQTMIPLDGRGCLQTATQRTCPRPIGQIQSLLEPQSIAVLGASSKRSNFGRIILNNIKECGFPIEHLYVIKDEIEVLDEVRCVPTIADIPGKLDLLIMAGTVKDMPKFVDQLIEEGKVASVILIPGGLGETEGTQDIPARIRAAISAARTRHAACPIFLGGNCLGMRSRPGKFDTFFIESKKLDPRRNVEPRRVALISQSGAFVITRMSNLQTLDPRLAISIGNQLDLTMSDLLRAVGQREDIDAIGVYIEGFRDLDGSAFVRAVEDVTASGKVVVFYKAGRTEAGRSATAGHTASIAGDYDICQTGVANAGAIVTETFKEFEQLMELATALHHKEVGGVRVGAISNAGYETVGMADAIQGPSHEVELPEFSKTTCAALGGLLAKHRLDRLVNLRNPLDLTPMANDEVYEDCIRTMLADEEIDAVVAASVPLTPEMRNMPDEIEGPDSTASRLSALFHDSTKPLVAVIDAGTPFEPLVFSLRSAGVPVFSSSDQAIRSLGRYLCHRSRMAQPRPVKPATRAGASKRDPVIA